MIRQVKYYQNHKDEINKKRHDQLNARRLSEGKLTIEDERLQSNRKLEAKHQAKMILRESNSGWENESHPEEVQEWLDLLRLRLQKKRESAQRMRDQRWGGLYRLVAQGMMTQEQADAYYAEFPCQRPKKKQIVPDEKPVESPLVPVNLFDENDVDWDDEYQGEM